MDSPNSFRSTKGNPKKYNIEGIGVDLESPLLDYSIIDEFLEISDEDAFSCVPKLASTGFLVGLSSGAVTSAAYTYTKTLKKEDCVVIIFGDSGRAYLTKHVFTQPENKTAVLRRNPTKKQSL